MARMTAAGTKTIRTETARWRVREGRHGKEWPVGKLTAILRNIEKRTALK